MMSERGRRGYRALLKKAFDVGVILKGVDGVLEVGGGLLLAFTSPALLGRVVVFLTAHELSEDPRDFVANQLLRAAQDFSLTSHAFGVVYLISHGVVKLVLVVSLLKRRLWSYPAAILFFALFIVYQLYRYSYSGSLWLIALSVLDFAVIWLTWFEYRRLKEAKG